MGEGFRKFIRDAGKIGLVLGALHGSPDKAEAKPIVPPENNRLAEIIDGDKKVAERDPALIPADVMEHYREHSKDDDTDARDDGGDEAYRPEKRK
ncbi:MAG: hypothetical protein US42_C0003G0034 [Candidatus Magasanikbacteria bacterium GW2011_GWC2_37_14]|uniref:Uncharacterized protein n=1 Tax=Candidatus Magasanikbacteria bacterium GW2011_GWC2_37_14 TaxID=1619046 RepID=A0A0G0GD97_9BACT|nr:MAG: hypothetical protein US42_C0003G0034 [Candidatus Magasanikbacteria bacterium GW2011_GWC2_37_14]